LPAGEEERAGSWSDRAGLIAPMGISDMTHLSGWLK
jgi:hypothetical protein